MCKVGFPGGAGGKEPAFQCRRLRFDPLIRKIPWRRAWQPTPVFLPEEFPWTEQPGRLQSMGLQRVGHNWSNLVCTHTHTQSVRQANTYERLSERTGVITWWIRKWQPSCISRSEIQVNESYNLLCLIFHLIKSCRYRDDVLFVSAFPSKIKMVNEHLIRGWMCGWVTQWRIFWGMICLEAHGNTPLLRAGDWDWHIYTIDTMYKIDN